MHVGDGILAVDHLEHDQLGEHDRREPVAHDNLVAVTREGHRTAKQLELWHVCNPSIYVQFQVKRGTPVADRRVPRMRKVSGAQAIATTSALFNCCATIWPVCVIDLYMTNWL